MVQEDIITRLREVIHPEKGSDIVSLGMVENLLLTPDQIRFTLHFSRSRDPFASALKKACETALSTAFPHYAGRITIFIKEAAPQKTEPKKPQPGSWTGGIGAIIAISSAKGGVGKSTVTANLAVTLQREGYRVGILDADIYGPSQPTLFGVEGYKPTGDENGETPRIFPALSHGVKIMSIGFFIDPKDALIWRGPMATNALRQLVHQTDWGELDFLLIDMPPGTGDIHLSLMQDLKISGAIIVSTPQKIALADVRRGIQMFRAPQINIPVMGIVENMAWFTPAELPENRYYLFGQGGARELAHSEGLPLLAEIPLIQGVREGADQGDPAAASQGPSSPFYAELARNLIAELKKISG